MPTHKQQHRKDHQLARTLGIPEVALLGVGALLGGGIFTLLGSASSFAGGGLVLSMLLGSAVAFINLNAYVALATTFPQAGGAYHWIREGLGDLSGFMSGWCSWMASAVACALYAVSFAYFMQELLFNYFALPHTFFSDTAWFTIFTLSVLFIFGLINYRGVKLSGKIGGAIVLVIISILVFYIVYGVKHMVASPELVVFNFTPFLPMGIAGVIQAAALFYIAFEGSEIQAQTGEEVENPAKVLRVGLFSSWAIVSIVYVLIALIIVGATDGRGVPSWQLLGNAGERAIIESAGGLMPLGYLVMLIGGLLANIAALNATIYSSSRVLFSLGRDRLVFAGLGVMHPINYVPTRALIVSLFVIGLVSVWLPLTDIASAASMLFIVLFLLLNIAYIQLRRKKPEATWEYVVPLGHYLPLLAVLLYSILAVALFHVSPVALYFLLIWILLGLVNYFGYAKRLEREDIARDVVYEHSTRFHPKSEYRVVLPVGREESWHQFSQIAWAMTKQEGGDLMALRIHEMKAGEDIAEAFHSSEDKKVLEEFEQEMASKQLNIDTRIIASHSVAESILETVESEKANLVLLNWDGAVDTKKYIFGRKIDVVLHRAQCDLLTVKIRAHKQNMKKVVIPVSIDVNPNLRFTGKVASALCQSFDAVVTVVMVVPRDVRGSKDAYYKKLLDARVRELKIKSPSEVTSMLVYADHLARGIVKAASEYDVVLLPAARGHISRAIGVGDIPEQVAKSCRNKTVMIAKGYRGMAQPFWEFILRQF